MTLPLPLLLAEGVEQKTVVEDLVQGKREA